MTEDQLIREDAADCAEQLAVMEECLLSLEGGGTRSDGVLVNRLRQATRSMVDGVGVCRLASARILAQRTERTLGEIDLDRAAPGAERVTVLLRAIDTLRTMLHHRETAHGSDISEIVRDLAMLRAGNPALRQRVEPTGRFRSLVVEDDFTGRLLLQTFLSRYGECHIAVNGREAVDAFAIALARAESYDVICMDIMMPEMDGEEAVRRIRAIEDERGILSHCGAKIFMTTAVNNVREVMACFRDLCDAYLVKPIDLTQLLGQLRSHHLV